MKKKTKIILTTAAVAVIATPLMFGISQAKEKWGNHQWKNSGHSMMQGGHMQGGRMQHMAKMIEEIDTNKDGAISAEELKVWQDGKISKFDSNANGTIELDEFEALWLEQKRSRMVDKFQHFDENGDGQITVGEIATPMNFMFQHMDRNNDGNITKEEMDQMHRYKKGRHNDDDDD